jgi:hypothetical protein
MKKLIIFVAAIVCAMNANADPITGSVSFSGSVKFDTGNPATANAITQWSNTKVEDADGVFGLFLSSGSPVTFTAPYTFDPSTPMSPLWTAGGFSFNLASSIIQAQFSAGPLQFLNISGTGTVTGNGYSSTPGNWTFTSQSPSVSGKFSFSAATDSDGQREASVPDSSSTLVLLVLALGGLRLVRLKLAV